MSSAQALSGRWSAELTEAACRALSAGEMLSPFGRHTVENRSLHDFRGLNLDHQAIWQYGFQNLRLHDADFSAAIIATLGNREPVRIEHCRFDKARFEGNLGVRVSKSSFRQARLDRVQFYSDSSFSACDFSGANLYAVRSFSSEFIRCRFDAANLSQANLIGCDLVDCSWDKVRFSGTSLAESWISLPGFPGPFDAQTAGSLADFARLDLSDLDEGMGTPTEQELLALLPMPTLILSQVHWLDPADPETLLTGSIRRRWVEARELRRLQDLQARQIPLLSSAREAFRQGHYAATLESLAEATRLCPLPASAETLLRLAQRRAESAQKA